METLIQRMGALANESDGEAMETRKGLCNLPVELQLACLARVPYKDLREIVTCTCKSWKDLVADDAFRKTRAEAGFVEWAVFVGACDETANCYLITASGTYLTAQRPPVCIDDTIRLASASGDKVAVLEPEFKPHTGRGWEPTTLRMYVYDPRRNSWSPLRTPDRVFDGDCYVSLTEYVGIETVGDTIYVFDGRSEGRYREIRDPDSDDSDAVRVEWKDVSLRSIVKQGPGRLWRLTGNFIEVDGKIWCYSSRDFYDPEGRREGETYIYDPETDSWTDGPDLPHELFGIGGSGLYHCNAFAREGRFCVVAKFRGGEHRAETDGAGTYSYRTFAWDPAREEWDENPFPPPPRCAIRCSCIDDYLVAFATEPVGGIDGDNPDEVAAFRQGQTTNLYVLKPGDTEWAEWRLPAGARTLGTRVAAVRLG